MSVATALYQQVYCRYLCPGEAIVHDRGPEFCNQIVRDLQEHFGVNIRVISAGKPRANGLIETGVNLWKSRGRALMAEGGNVLVLKNIFEMENCLQIGMLRFSTRFCLSCEAILIQRMVLLLDLCF